MTPSARAGDANAALNATQVNIVVVLWVSYAAFYLGRLNLSPALPEIAASLQIGLGEVGILGNIFFWSYAIGQVISGQLGSIFQPHWVVFAGMLLVGVANVAFSFQTTLVTMGICWGVNGFAQSMGWGPVLRILSSKTSSEQKRRLALIFSMTFQVGTSLAWGLAAILIAVADFRMAFMIPGVLLLVTALVWRFVGLDAETQPEAEATANTENKISNTLANLIKDLRQMFPVLLVAGLVGFIYVGFLLWLPTLVQDWMFIPDGISSILTAIIPLIGIPGMVFSGRLLTRQANLFRTLVQLLVGLLLWLTLCVLASGALQVITILLAVMFASGLAGMLLSAAPMLLMPASRVSSAGGLVTATWSIAGGLAGTVVGSIAESNGWDAVYYLWIANTGLAILITLAASRWMNTNRTAQGDTQ